MPRCGRATEASSLGWHAAGLLSAGSPFSEVGFHGLQVTLLLAASRAWVNHPRESPVVVILASVRPGHLISAKAGVQDGAVYLTANVVDDDSFRDIGLFVLSE